MRNFHNYYSLLVGYLKPRNNWEARFAIVVIFDKQFEVLEPILQIVSIRSSLILCFLPNINMPSAYFLEIKEHAFK